MANLLDTPLPEVVARRRLALGPLKKILQQDLRNEVERKKADHMRTKLKAALNPPLLRNPTVEDAVFLDGSVRIPTARLLRDVTAADEERGYSVLSTAIDASVLVVELPAKRYRTGRDAQGCRATSSRSTG